jgi:hypothetical protein
LAPTCTGSGPLAFGPEHCNRRHRLDRRLAKLQKALVPVETFITPSVKNACNEPISIGFRITHRLMAILARKNQRRRCGWFRHVFDSLRFKKATDTSKSSYRASRECKPSAKSGSSQEAAGIHCTCLYRVEIGGNSCCSFRGFMCGEMDGDLSAAIAELSKSIATTSM